MFESKPSSRAIRLRLPIKIDHPTNIDSLNENKSLVVGLPDQRVVGPDTPSLRPVLLQVFVSSRPPGDAKHGWPRRQM